MDSFTMDSLAMQSIGMQSIGMGTSAMPDDYILQGGDVQRDRDTVLSIWRGNLGEQQNMQAKYDWFYLGCPFGPPVLQLLQHVRSDTTAGTCAAGRRRMLWRGQPLAAGVMVDLAVRAEHRSLGPALMMQQGLIASGLRQLDLLYGFPNAKATAIFRRIGARKLTDIVRYARVLRPAQYLRRRLPALLAAPLGGLMGIALRLRDQLRRIGTPRLDASWSDRADARIDELWARSRQGDGLLAIRDAAHLRWRFDEAPAGHARYLLLSSDTGRTLCAWFCTQIDDNILHVRDFWSVDAADGIATRYIDALVDAAHALDVAAVSVEVATSPARMKGWHARGFIERSRRPVYACWSDGIDPDSDDFDLQITSADEDE